MVGFHEKDWPGSLWSPGLNWVSGEACCSRLVTKIPLGFEHCALFMIAAELPLDNCVLTQDRELPPHYELSDRGPETSLWFKDFS